MGKTIHIDITDKPLPLKHFLSNFDGKTEEIHIASKMQVSHKNKYAYSFFLKVSNDPRKILLDFFIFKLSFFNHIMLQFNRRRNL